MADSEQVVAKRNTPFAQMRSFAYPFCRSTVKPAALTALGRRDCCAGHLPGIYTGALLAASGYRRTEFFRRSGASIQKEAAGSPSGLRRLASFQRQHTRQPSAALLYRQRPRRHRSWRTSGGALSPAFGCTRTRPQGSRQAFPSAKRMGLVGWPGVPAQRWADTFPRGGRQAEQAAPLCAVPSPARLPAKRGHVRFAASAAGQGGASRSGRGLLHATAAAHARTARHRRWLALQPLRSCSRSRSTGSAVLWVRSSRLWLAARLVHHAAPRSRRHAHRRPSLARTPGLPARLQAGPMA